MVSQEQAVEMVKSERLRQNDKWGFPQHNTPFEWISILTEEVGELAQAVNDAYFGEGSVEDRAKVIDEAVHVSAVALSIVEHMQEEKNMLDKTKDYKIDISTLSMVERTRLQEELFEMGYGWHCGGRKVAMLDADTLFLSTEMKISFGSKKDFSRYDYSILTVSDIMPQPMPEERTLRDWFAGLALSGMLPSDSEPLELLARDAYRYADAMLKERNK